MIDTINIYIDSDKKLKRNFFSHLDHHSVDKPLPESSDFSQKQYWAGNYKNFKVWYNGRRLRLNGSLTKYYFSGQNLSTLTREKVEDAIFKLSEEVGLPLHKGIITRVDIGENYIVEKTVKYYQGYFGGVKLLKKRSINLGETTYLSNNSRGMIFYDKKAEMTKSSSHSLPLRYKGKEIDKINVLRYELSIPKTSQSIWIKKILVKNGFNDFEASLLYNTTIYNSLVDLWFDAFQSIPKIKEYAYPLSEINSKKQLKNYLAQVGLSVIGYDLVIDMIDSLKGQIHRKIISDIKKSINELVTSTHPSQLDPSISKLCQDVFLTALYQKAMSRI